MKKSKSLLVFVSVSFLVIIAVSFGLGSKETSFKETHRNSYYNGLAGNLKGSFPTVLIQTEFREKEVIAYPPEYAGAYIDGSNTLHIVLSKYANRTTKLNYQQIMGNDEDIIYEIADFPLSHLREIQSTLTEAMREQKFSIDGISVNEITNKVEIHRLDITEEKEIAEFLKNKFNDFDVRCIIFKEPLRIELTAADTASNTLAGSNTANSSMLATSGTSIENAQGTTIGNYSIKQFFGTIDATFVPFPTGISHLIEQYGLGLDIVYEDSKFPVGAEYSNVFYWNQTV